MRWCSNSTAVLDPFQPIEASARAGVRLNQRVGIHWPRTVMNTGTAETVVSYNAAHMNRPLVHADLIATFKRAEADARHKMGLINKVAQKGPKAIQAAADTAARAERRRARMRKS